MYFTSLLKHQFLYSSINLLAILLPRYSSITYNASSLAVFSLTRISSATYPYIYPTTLLFINAIYITEFSFNLL